MNNTKLAQALQKKTLSICIVVVAVIVGITLFLGREEDKPKEQAKVPVHDISKDLTDERYWMWDYAGRVKQHEQQLSTLENKLNSNEATNHLLATVTELKQQNEELVERLDKLENEHNNLPSQQWKRPDRFVNDNTAPNSGLPTFEDAEKLAETLPAYEEEHDFSANKELKNVDLAAPGFQTYNFKLAGNSNNADKSNIKDTIPSNSFIKAVLLNGVDISAGEASQQNPQPVILRVTGWGNLPNGHRLRQLKQCRIHAISWGDLSSERVYMRPDLLTCVSTNGDIVETSVEGHVAAADGKLGVRGRMITRDAELVRSAVMAGTLSGLGETAASTQGTTSVSPLGSTRTFNGKEALTSSLGKGVGKGLDLVAEYKIKQAEKLQPIIQVSGGLEVEVLFFASSKIGELKTKTEAAKPERSNEQEVLDTITEINQKLGEKPK
jgi:TolA-binding protein